MSKNALWDIGVGISSGVHMTLWTGVYMTNSQAIYNMISQWNVSIYLYHDARRSINMGPCYSGERLPAHRD